MPVRKWIEETPIPQMHTTLIDPEIAKLMSTSMQIMNAEGEIQHMIISALWNEIYIGDKVILPDNKDWTIVAIDYQTNSKSISTETRILEHVQQTATNALGPWNHIITP